MERCLFTANVRLLERSGMCGQIEDRWSRVPQRAISMALLWGGLVTFRTMIRQAAVAFAQALASSVQETLHSGLLLSVWSCIHVCTSIFGWLWKQQQCWSWPVLVNYEHLSQDLRVCLKSHVVSSRTSYEETRGFLSYLSSHCENVEGATETPKMVNHCCS